MTTRVLASITIAATTVILLCSGLVTALFGGPGGTSPTTCYLPQNPSASAAPAPTRSAPPGGYPAIAGWTTEQVGNAATIIAVGQQLGVPRTGWVIAIATALQESTLRNLPGGDRDSIGLFQQRPSQGWGTPAQLQDPIYAATKFYQALLRVPGWQQMPLTEAAQAVQISDFPGEYADDEDDANTLVTALAGADPGGCFATGPWTQPVNAPVGSGFRTGDRPGHDGVDLSAPRGTTIRAASAGEVIQMRCNAVDSRDGSDWGCDRDGDPNLTRGCGWYVDIAHAGGIITRYCHMGAPPAVAVGDIVTAGQPIGEVGSTGHSSGPHLHYEVHIHNDSSANGAVDPVPFMTQQGAPLGQTAAAACAEALRSCPRRI